MTQIELKRTIHYDETTGQILLLVKTTNRQTEGEELHNKPYINLYGKQYSTLKVLALYIYNDYNTKLITLDGTNKYSLDNLFIVGSLTDAPVTQELVKKFLNYDSTTGKFTWISRYLPGIKLGSEATYVAGSLPDGGYKQLSLFGKIYKAHRLAWLYVYGDLPDKQLDHIDHDRTNNKITNLRLASQHTNMKNKSRYASNTSGYAGVGRHGSSWKASIGVNGSKVLLGVFKSIEEAIAARKAGEKLLNYHRNHGA